MLGNFSSSVLAKVALQNQAKPLFGKARPEVDVCGDAYKGA